MNVEKLYFSYGKQRIIEDISFTLEQGQCMAVIGSNGSGKSTLLALLAGILKPDSGSVSVSDKLGYVPQGTALFEDMSVEYNIRFFAALSRSKTPDVLPYSLEQYRYKRVSTLSGGNKKRLSIACALIGNPDVLLLDEPLASLDYKIRNEIISELCRLKAHGKSIVIVSHDPAEYISFYDALLYINNGFGCFYTFVEANNSETIRDEYILRDKLKKIVYQ